MERIRVAFKGKVVDATDWNTPGLPKYKAVKLPKAIQSHHVVTPIPQLGTRARTWMMDQELMRGRTRAAFDRAGLFYDIPVTDERVTLLGNGFMALVELDLEV